MNVQYQQGQSGEIISGSETSTPSCDATVSQKHSLIPQMSLMFPQMNSFFPPKSLMFLL